MDQGRQAGGGDGAAFVSPLSRQRGAAVAERYRLQPGQSLATAGPPKAMAKWSLTSLQQRLVKAGGRLIKACPLILVAASGAPSDAAAVCRHAGQDRGFAATGGIGGSWRSPSNRASKERTVEGRLQIGHRCAGGRSKALETTQATPSSAQIRSRLGARGPDRFCYGLEADYENTIGDVKAEIPD